MKSLKQYLPRWIQYKELKVSEAEHLYSHRRRVWIQYKELKDLILVDRVVCFYTPGIQYKELKEVNWVAFTSIMICYGIQYKELKEAVSSYRSTYIAPCSWIQYKELKVNPLDSASLSSLMRNPIQRIESLSAITTYSQWRHFRIQYKELKGIGAQTQIITELSQRNPIQRIES